MAGTAHGVQVGLQGVPRGYEARAPRLGALDSDLLRAVPLLLVAPRNAEVRLERQDPRLAFRILSE